MADADDAETRIQVVVRVRPVLPHESAEDVAVTCSTDTSAVQVLVPERGASHSNPKEQLPGTARLGARSYSFDACLPGSTSQAELFEVCGIPELVAQALDGFAVTIFAFGQTGSGKTHTVIGSRLSRGGPAAVLDAPSSSPSEPGTHTNAALGEEDGLLPRCLAEVFAGVQARANRCNYSVTASCVELYHEAVSDLMSADKAKQLQVRKDERGCFQVEGLTQRPCTSAGEAARALGAALARRHTRAHALNDYSSRSHCLMTLSLASQEVPQPGAAQGAKGGVRRYGRLVLVDLAGSERLKDTGSTGREAVRETGSINKSLFTLGQVLAALAQRSGSARGGTLQHVPYRDSKLTQLLWDGLRGGGRALMLACLGPLRGHAEEALSTLHFAAMAQRIKSRPVILLDPQDALVMELRDTIRALREENRQLATAMAALTSGADTATILAALPDSLRLAAARNGMGSAPPGQPPSHQLQGADEAPGIQASRLPVRLPPPATAPESSAAGGRGAVGPPPWNQLPQGTAAGGAEVLRVEGREEGAAPSPWPTSQPPALCPGPGAGAVAHSYTFAQAPRAKPHQSHQPRRRSSQPSASASASPAGAAAAKGAALRISTSANSSTARWASPVRLPAGSPSLPPPPPLSPTKSSPAQVPRQSRPSPPPRTAAAAAPRQTAFEQGGFSELAALEAEFQALLRASRVPEKSVASQSSSSTSYSGGDSSLAGRDSSAVASHSGSSRGVSEEQGLIARVEGQQQGVSPVPEPEALGWVERNPWFGSDPDMTACAYTVHDELVAAGLQGADAAYYRAIEQQVATRFPDKWAALLRAQAAPPAQTLPPDSLAAGCEARAGPADPAEPAQQQPSSSSLEPRQSPAAGASGGAWAGLSGSGQAPGPGPAAPAAPCASFAPQRQFLNMRLAAASRPLQLTNRNRRPQPGAAAPAMQRLVHSGSGHPGATAWQGTGAAAPPQLQRASQQGQLGLGRIGHAGSAAVSTLGSPGEDESGETGPATTVTTGVSSSSSHKHAVSGPESSVAGGRGAVGPPPWNQLPPGTASGGPQVLRVGGREEGAAPSPTHHPASTRSTSQPALHCQQGPESPWRGAAGAKQGQSSPSQGAANPGQSRPQLAAVEIRTSKNRLRGMLSQLPEYRWHDGSWQSMQAEYARQRQEVLEELRRAKQDAEDERKKILMRIGMRLGNSRWQS
ncbi:P-loop containing nucleoside triphosphate hydrolase protein [Haematococcus lacustris]